MRRTVEGLSIVIPAWNEEDRLVRTLDRYLPSLEARGDPYEVIVVVDGVADGTADVVRRYASRHVRLLEFPRKLGKGGAILKGLHAAQFDYVGYIDADGPIPPDKFLGLAQNLVDVDCVVASRWLRGSRVIRKEPTFNLVAGRLWNVLVRSLLFLPVQDTQCGAKFIRRSVLLPTLRCIALTNRAFDIDLLYHLNKSGRRIREMPVTWSHDPDTRMPIGKAIPIMFLSLLGMRIMNLPVGKRIPKRWVHWFLQKWGTV
jgi:glycosyltransferase involved in cell wall biosynthesis